MVVEDAAKSSSSALENPNPNPTARGDEEDDEPEEGEIVGDEDSGSSKQSKGIIQQPHPLEHSWTFWFDSPTAKSKQTAWGNSIRPIYTFTTVEKFWRFVFFVLYLLFAESLILILLFVWVTRK